MEYPLITVAETRPFQRKVAHTPGQGLEARVMSKAFAEIGSDPINFARALGFVARVTNVCHELTWISRTAGNNASNLE